MRTASASASALAGAPADGVFARLLAHDPVRFYPRSGILPAVTAVHDASGSWDTPGRTRRLEQSNGGTVVETIRVVESPTRFAYDLTDFTGFFATLVASARAEWRLTTTAGGTTIDWTYTFTARPGRGPIVAAIVRLAWAGYMRRVLPAIADWTAGHSQSIPTR